MKKKRNGLGGGEDRHHFKCRRAVWPGIVNQIGEGRGSGYRARVLMPLDQNAGRQCAWRTLARHSAIHARWPAAIDALRNVKLNHCIEDQRGCCWE